MKEKALVHNGNKIRTLLTVTAIFESGTGLVLIALPQLLITLLLGSFIDSVIISTVARMAGVAIFALAVACWFARNDEQGHAARGLVSAMFVYNTAICIVLVYSATGLVLSGVGLWPIVLVHAAMSTWCILCLLK